MNQLPTPHTTDTDPRGRGRRTFLWLMAGLCLFFLFVMAQQLMKVLDATSRVVGNGKTVESYKYDLSKLTVDARLLAASGGPKDAQKPLIDPAIIDRAKIDKLNEDSRRKFLTSDEAIVGVAVGGAARAYPLRMLWWHEIVNDELGGVPIAVTYSPLCDSIVVFDRRVDGQTLTLGYSGLVYNSNLVMYDRREGGKGESLWSQLRREAISGPLAGKKLATLPLYVGPWKRWAESHPQTTALRQGEMKPALRMMGPDPNPFKGYLERQVLRFPVAPLVPESSPVEPWRRVVIERVGDGYVATPADHKDTGDASALWWAWYAMYPQTKLAVETK